MRAEIVPATPDRWGDLERLFGERGACGGCWCMSWRLPRKVFVAQKGKANRRALKKLVVESGRAPGLIAYVDGTPAGWCSVAPREQFPALARSKVLAPVDDQPVWSVSCLFVLKPFRRRGLSLQLLRAAAEYARTQGARIVEGYPTEPSKPLPDAFVWTGLASAFRQAGFAEAVRRSDQRPIMRCLVRVE